MDSTSAVTGFLEKRVKKIIRATQDATGNVAPQLRLQTSPTHSPVEAPKVPRTCIAKPLTSNPPLDFAERQPNKPSTLPPSIQADFKQARETGYRKPIKVSDKEDTVRMLDLEPDFGETEETADKESSAISDSDDHEAVQCDSTEIGNGQDNTTEESEPSQPKEVEKVLELDDFSKSTVSRSQATQADDITETNDSTGPTSPLWDAVQSEEFEQALETDDSSDSEDSEWECVTSARIASDHESLNRNKSRNRRQKIFDRPQELDSMISAFKQGSGQETVEDCADDS